MIDSKDSFYEKSDLNFSHHRPMFLLFLAPCIQFAKKIANFLHLLLLHREKMKMDTWNFWTIHSSRFP